MKKKYLKIVFIMILLWSCGDDDMEAPNTAPSVPVLKYPTDNLLCINNDLTFEWNISTDNQGDKITYAIEIATDNQFNNIVHNSKTDILSKKVLLDKGKAYYWRVKAIDEINLISDFSNIWQFYTEGVGETNHFPFSPALIKPSFESTIPDNSSVLEWSASDVDSGDTLKYNVYLGTTNTPSLVSENQTVTTYTATSLSSNTYYWRIDVIDSKGAKTIGQLWSFTVSN